MPTARVMRTGELVLIDAGAEDLGYVSDITRTFCVGGVMDATQQELHAVVHAAQRAAIERVPSGVEWRDVHLTAALAIADGLVAAGILRGDARVAGASPARSACSSRTGSATWSGSASATPASRCTSAATTRRRIRT